MQGLFLGAILLCAATAYSTQAQADNVLENSISFSKETDSSKWCYPYQHVDHDDFYVDRIIAITNDNLIYRKYDDYTQLSTYYKYNMKSNTTYKLGEIPGCSMYSGDMVQIGDKIYMYLVNPYGSHDYTSADVQQKDVCVLYEIDTAANTVRAVRKEIEDIYLMISVDVLGDALISNRTTRNVDPMMTYIDVTAPTGNGQYQTSELLSLRYDEASKTGKDSTHFSQDNNDLYLFVRESHGEAFKYQIEKYTKDGQLVKIIPFDSVLTEAMADRGAAYFEVVGNYAVITIRSGNPVICDISGDTAVTKVMPHEDISLQMALHADTGKNNGYMVLFNKHPAYVFLLDSNKQVLHQLDVGYQHLGYVVRDDKNNIIIAKPDSNYYAAREGEAVDNEHSIYVNFLDLPILKSYSLLEEDVVTLE